MAKVSRIAWLFLTAALVATACAPPAPIGSSQWLLSSLQRLADEGALFDPSRVEQVLSMQAARSAPMEAYPQPPDCSNPDLGRSLISSRYPASPEWLRPTAEGIQGMRVPAFAINPAAVSGDPRLDYSAYTLTACSDRYGRLGTMQNATLHIWGLPAFACYQRSDLEQRFGEKEQIHTDGVSSVSYEVAGNDQRSAVLSFTFRAGAPCAVDVRLNQAVEHGRRYKRASARWHQCRMGVWQRYSQENGPVNWFDNKGNAQRREAVAAACGSLASYYDREPA